MWCKWTLDILGGCVVTEEPSVQYFYFILVLLSLPCYGMSMAWLLALLCADICMIVTLYHEVSTIWNWIITKQLIQIRVDLCH